LADYSGFKTYSASAPKSYGQKFVTKLDALQSATLARLAAPLAACVQQYSSVMYRVGQKSKLLILSEYVDKTEKTGGM